MKDKDFNYRKAEADLEEVGCRYSEELYEFRNSQNRDSFLREHDLNPDKYKSSDSTSGSGGKPSGGSGSNESCYLTTACVRAKGLPDDCRELQALRAYRDGYLLRRKGGRADVDEYYRFAPDVVRAVNAQPNADALWQGVYEDLVLPCVKLIEAGRMEETYELYRSRANALAKTYLQ